MLIYNTYVSGNGIDNLGMEAGQRSYEKIICVYAFGNNIVFSECLPEQGGRWKGADRHDRKRRHADRHGS